MRKGHDHVGLCPFHQERTPSFTVNEGKRFWHCFGCGAHGSAAGYLMARHRMHFLDAMEMLATHAGLAMPEGFGKSGPKPQLPPPAPPVDRPDMAALAREDERSIERARKLWRDTREPRGTPVEAYLQHRGLDAWVVDRIPPSLRYARLDYWIHRRGADKPVSLGQWPVMVAGMQDAEGRVRAVHLTYLAQDGRGKAGIVNPETREIMPVKKMRGAAWGCAIRLGPASERIGIGEGIESTGSVQIATGLSCWAAGSLNKPSPAPARAGSRGIRSSWRQMVGRCCCRPRFRCLTWLRPRHHPAARAAAGRDGESAGGRGQRPRM